jgi:hypothetical protein
VSSFFTEENIADICGQGLEKTENEVVAVRKFSRTIGNTEESM